MGKRQKPTTRELREKMKPKFETQEYLDFFEVSEYMQLYRGIDLSDGPFWDFLVDHGLRNDSFINCPILDETDFEYEKPELVNILKELYKEFSVTNDRHGLVFWVCW